MFERYTDEARRALFFSRYEATRFGATAIEAGHLLLALMSLKTGFVKRILGHISIDEMRREIATGGDREPTTATAEIPFSDDVNRALQDASDEAARLGRSSIGTEHLLLGLLRAETSAALLQRHGVRLDEVRAIVVSQAQQPTLFTVEPSPSPELLFTPYDPAAHSAFAFILAQPPLEGMAGHAAVLTNRSSQRITALVARWTAVDPAGGVRTKHVVRDNYFPPHRFDWLVPGGQVLATPGGFQEAISGPHIAWVSSGGSRLDHDAAAITVALDSAVLEDGRVIGADEHDIARYVHGRHAAVLEFVGQVRDAEAAGADVDALLTAIANSASDRTEHRPWHRQQWAMQALRSRHFLESLRNLPEPPQIWR